MLVDLSVAKVRSAELVYMRAGGRAAVLWRSAERDSDSIVCCAATDSITGGRWMRSVGCAFLLVVFAHAR